MDLEKTMLKIQNLRETADRYMQRKDALEVIGTYFQDLISKIFGRIEGTKKVFSKQNRLAR